MMRFLTYGAAALLLGSVAQAQDAPLTCNMAVICLEASPCSDWEQVIEIAETETGWQIIWSEDRITDYAELADLPAPDASLEPVDIRSLSFSDPDNQTVQIVTLAEDGNVVVTMHQPHLRPRAVTGFGTCSSQGAE